MTVCSRVNLCNSWCIFWLSETKTLLGFALYTQGISFQTDTFQRVYKCDRDRLRRIWDYYNTVKPRHIILIILFSMVTLYESLASKLENKEKQSFVELTLILRKKLEIFMLMPTLLILFSRLTVSTLRVN